MSDQAKISINIETNGAEKAKKDLTDIANVSPKVAEGAEKIEKATTKLNSSYKSTGGQIRNASYQLQDFFVQVQGGTSITTSLSQQLPQLLSGFGLIGVVAGTAAAGIGILISSTNLFETALGKLERYAKASASSFDLIRDAQYKLGDDATRSLNTWAKSWRDASASVRDDMMRTLQLQLEFDQMQISILKQREWLDRLIAKGTAKETFTGTVLSGQANAQERADAQKRLMDLNMLEQRAKAVQERINNPGGSLKATEADKESFAITIQQRIDALQTEAKFIGVSNAEKEYGVMVAELEAQAKRMNIGLDKEQLALLKNLIYAKDTANSTKKLNEYVIQQQKAIELVRLEGQAILMTEREHKKLIEARQMEANIAKETMGMQEKDAQKYADTARSLYLLKQAIEDLNYANARTFGAGATKAIKGYMDELGNIAKDSQKVFENAFKGMEDAMVEAFKTGKLSFKSMIDMMMADISRLIVRQALLKPIYEGLGLTSTGGGINVGSLLSGVSGMLGNVGTALTYGTSIGSQQTAMLAAQNAGMGVPLADGTNIVPYDGFQATLHKGEAVVPAQYNPAVGGQSGEMNVTYSPVINIDSRTDQTQVRQLVVSAVQQGQVDLVERINRGQVRIKT